MEVKRDNFYVTLFSNASTDIFTLNLQTSFTNRLALPVNLGSSSDWEVGLCEISQKPPHRQISDDVGGINFVTENNVLIYCDLIVP